MIEKIDERIAKEVDKILAKEELTSEEVRILIDIKNDIKMEEKMKRMIEFAS
jgi:hypothetical protein